MFAIAQNNNGRSSIASTHTSDMSISDISISDFDLKGKVKELGSPALVYLAPSQLPSPKPVNIQFGTTEHVAPTVLHPDSGDKAKDSPLIPPQPFTAARPAQVNITVEVETKEEEEIGDDSSSTYTDDEDADMPSISTSSQVNNVRKNLHNLYTTLHRFYKDTKPGPTPPIKGISASPDDWSFSDQDSWDSSSTSPPQGDETHPPSQALSGDHPGMGWELNDPLTSYYYQTLIPDPTRPGQLIVAPWISYSISRRKAEIQVTFGKDYPIHTRALVPLRVDYNCPPISDHQQNLFLESDAKFAQAVNRIVSSYFPLHVTAALRASNITGTRSASLTAWPPGSDAASNRPKGLRCQEQERAMLVLSDLENTNFLGRLLAHEDEILVDLRNDPLAAEHFIRLANQFTGPITKSALDATPNPFRKSDRSLAERPTSNVGSPCARKTAPSYLEVRGYSRAEADRAEDHLRDQLRQRRAAKAPRVYSTKTCHRCRQVGHIRAQCRTIVRKGTARK